MLLLQLCVPAVHKLQILQFLLLHADDGVMPQTVEAINHAKAAGVPIIVAVNKIDKQRQIQITSCKNLLNIALVPEDWGGDTIFVQISALQGDGIDNLLEMILLVSEMQEYKANPKRATGTVIEANWIKVVVQLPHYYSKWYISSWRCYRCW